MEKKNFIVTEEMIREAVDYVPLSKKVALAQTIAPKCIQKSKTAEQNQKGLEFLSLPCIWVDDLEMKELYCMAILLKEYLGVDVPDEFSDDEYDLYAGSHILYQLERFKGNYELKNKVFDILGDYKKLEKFINTYIQTEKDVRNDGVARLSASIAISTNPENLKKMTEELKVTLTEYEAARADARAKIEGKVEEA